MNQTARFPDLPVGVLLFAPLRDDVSRKGAKSKHYGAHAPGNQRRFLSSNRLARKLSNEGARLVIAYADDSGNCLSKDRLQIDGLILAGAQRLLARSANMRGLEAALLAPRLHASVKKYILKDDPTPAPATIDKFIDGLHADDLVLVIACERGDRPPGAISSKATERPSGQRLDRLVQTKPWRMMWRNQSGPIFMD